MRLVQQILACCLSIILFFISWPPNSLPGFVFIAFVPLLWIVFTFNSRQRYAPFRLFLLLCFAFFGFNFSLTSWVMNAHWGGGLFASVFNTLLMASTLYSVYKVRVKLGEKHAFLAFPIFWIAFEYLHLNWELTWPWMTLGNVFAEKTSWIQWYEITGVLGGSFWVLLVNSTIFYVIKKQFLNQSNSKALLLALVFLLIPIGYSYQIESTFEVTPSNSIDVVIVQPNYEPHFEKFKIPQEQQLQRVENMLDSVWSTNPDLIILPETFIVDWVWESRVEQEAVIKQMKSWLENHPKTQILTGASTGKVMDVVDTKKNTARRSRGGTWYEVFNTALLISAQEPTQIFHKSKLVPGAEMTPYSWVLKPVLEKFPIELGGSIENFGVNDSIFNLKSNQGDLAPMICYESVFGEYVGSFVQNGANWICIITNDGWWKNTYGHQQHNAYARLRAIENRRWIVRSANTGISSVINPLGGVEQFLPYETSGIIQTSIEKYSIDTYYSQHGDYLGRLACFLTIIYLLQLILSYLKKDAMDLKSLTK